MFLSVITSDAKMTLGKIIYVYIIVFEYNVNINTILLCLILIYVNMNMNVALECEMLLFRSTQLSLKYVFNL